MVRVARPADVAYQGLLDREGGTHPLLVVRLVLVGVVDVADQGVAAGLEVQRDRLSLADRSVLDLPINSSPSPASSTLPSSAVGSSVIARSVDHDELVHIVRPVVRCFERDRACRHRRRIGADRELLQRDLHGLLVVAAASAREGETGDHGLANHRRGILRMFPTSLWGVRSSPWGSVRPPMQARAYARRWVGVQ